MLPRSRRRAGEVTAGDIVRGTEPRTIAAMRRAVVPLLALMSSAALARQQPAPSGIDTIVIEDSQRRLAVPECVPTSLDPASRDICRDVAAVVRADLEFEELFRFVPAAELAHLARPDIVSPPSAEWRRLVPATLVTTHAGIAHGRLTVTVRAWFLETSQLVVSRRFEGAVADARAMAHRISDEIVAATAQTRGVAHTRIAFSSDRHGSRGRTIKELYVVDYDGWNPRRLTLLDSISILPAWNRDGRSLALVSWVDGSPDVVLQVPGEARLRRPRLGGSGQATSPAFSPDGRRLAFASSRSGDMEIWVADADGTAPRRLTNHAASDTAPAWSPTGTEIAFTSSRTGPPHIWLMDAEGLNLRRLTHGGYQDGAAWNPAREYPEIAFTSRVGDQFEIVVHDLETGIARQITHGLGDCEFPTWAPSGRHLAFSCRREGRWRLTVTDRLGRRFTELDVGPGDNVQPDWGP